MKALQMTFLWLLLTSCAGDQGEGQSSIQNIVSTIQEEAETLIQDGEITNRVALIQEKIHQEPSNMYDEYPEVISNTTDLTELYSDAYPMDQETPMVTSTMLMQTNDDPVHPEYPQVSRVAKQPRYEKLTPVPNQDLVVVDSRSYIKIGVDKPNLSVSANKSEKITVAILTKPNIPLVDVYIYAIPITSKLVRNHNTLVGFINNLEVINNQAQFTRFWVGRRSNRTWFRKGKYNIYVEYRYKNKYGDIIGLEGRYWGGSSRKWTITVR